MPDPPAPIDLAVGSPSRRCTGPVASPGTPLSSVVETMHFWMPFIRSQTSPVACTMFG